MSMRRFLCVFVGVMTLTIGSILPAEETPGPRGELLVVVGAPGEESYVEPFERTSAAWVKAGKAAGLNTHVIGDETDKAETHVIHREQLQQWLTDQHTTGSHLLWLVFVGHGTYDGRQAKINLVGQDVSAVEMRQWLAPIQRPMVIVHGGSASAPFVNALSASDRIIVTATENGNEINYARFGERFALAITNPDSDIDRDGQISVLEAFVSAAIDTEIFYDGNGRLSTEHALIDDNGDGRGTPFDWFNGTRLSKQAETEKAQPDGDRARLLSLIPSPEEQAMTDAQRLERAALESEVKDLRARKSELSEEEYYHQLESIFRQLSRVYVPSNDTSVDER